MGGRVGGCSDRWVGEWVGKAKLEGKAVQQGSNLQSWKDLSCALCSSPFRPEQSLQAWLRVRASSSSLGAQRRHTGLSVPAGAMDTPCTPQHRAKADGMLCRSSLERVAVPPLPPVAVPLIQHVVDGLCVEILTKEFKTRAHNRKACRAPSRSAPKRPHWSLPDGWQDPSHQGSAYFMQLQNPALASRAWHTPRHRPRPLTRISWVG